MDGCERTCGLASPQGVVASPQSYVGCGTTACKPKHQWGSGLKNLCSSFHHSVSYEWVLKKKHNFSFGQVGCTTCAAAPVYPTGQAYPSHQGVASGQYAAPQVYGAPQVRTTFAPARTTSSIASVPAEMTPAAPGGEEVPPAPEVRGATPIGSANGLLLPTPSGN